MRGTWGRGTGVVTGLALAIEAGAGGFLDPMLLTAEDETALAGWLADHDRPKAVHDVKGPLLALHVRGWQLEGVTSDTALAAYLALPGQRSFDLADLALRYLHRELRAEGPAGGQLTLDGSAASRTRRKPTSSGPGPWSTSPTRWTPTSSGARRPGCCARWSCR